MTRRSRGFTLTELCIAACMILVVLVGATSFFRDALRSMSGSAEEARRRNDVQAALERMQREVSLCTTDNARVVRNVAGQDALTIQVPVIMTSRGPIHGAKTRVPVLDGGFLRQNHPTWSVRFRVAGEELVREVVDPAGTVREGPDVLLRGVAPAKQETNVARPGFEASWADPIAAPSVLQVRLRTSPSEARPDGEEFVTTFRLVETR